MEPAVVAIALFTLSGLIAIALIADKKCADAERRPLNGGHDKLG